jgi:hypothetical protein
MPANHHFDFPNRIDLNAPPILVGRAALYYYGIGDRPAETDCVITEADFDRLAVLYPERVRKNWNDRSLSFEAVTFLRTIQLFCYNAIKANFISHENFAVISLDRLYSITSLDFTNPRRENDMVRILTRMKEPV